MTEDELIEQRWYAVPDDTSGCWAAANVDKPVSQHDPRGRGEVCVGNLLGEVTARGIANLHNALLDGVLH